MAVILAGCATGDTSSRSSGISATGRALAGDFSLPDGRSDAAVPYVLLEVPCAMAFVEAFNMRIQIEHRGYSIVYEGAEPGGQARGEARYSTVWLLESERARSLAN
ncbi:MAG: hypothetical protein AB8H80_16030 [Planctomycetota bacterium]